MKQQAIDEVPLNEIQTWLHQREAEMRLMDLKGWSGYTFSYKVLDRHRAGT